MPGDYFRESRVRPELQVEQDRLSRLHRCLKDAVQPGSRWSRRGAVVHLFT